MKPTIMSRNDSECWKFKKSALQNLTTCTKVVAGTEYSPKYTYIYNIYTCITSKLFMYLYICIFGKYKIFQYLFEKYKFFVNSLLKNVGILISQKAILKLTLLTRPNSKQKTSKCKIMVRYNTYIYIMYYVRTYKMYSPGNLTSWRISLFQKRSAHELWSNIYFVRK